ncbi:MAG: RNase P modulator RnpM [Dehalococcoidia bacterium]
MVTAAKGRPRPKHVPQRTCVSCRRTSAKRELVRVARSPQGQVEVDTTGKKAGRGAYLCRDAACWESALKRGRLEAALKTKIGGDDRQALLEFARNLSAASEA